MPPVALYITARAFENAIVAAANRLGVKHHFLLWRSLIWGHAGCVSAPLMRAVRVLQSHGGPGRGQATMKSCRFSTPPAPVVSRNRQDVLT